MRSFRARRLAALLSILLVALASAGCPELNRQPDYLGKQTVSLDAPFPAVAGETPAANGRMFDHANITMAP
jgi:hypothetical protein